MSNETKSFLIWYKNRIATPYELKNWQKLEAELIEAFEYGCGNRFLQRVIERFNSL